MNSVLETLTKAGVSIWLDDLTRTRITSGNLKELVATHSVRGVTTNPSIFEGAIAGSARTSWRRRRARRQSNDFRRCAKRM